MNIDNHTLMRNACEYLRYERLKQNIPQNILAARSGISPSALKHLESGKGATLFTFISVCRSLGKIGWIDTLAPKDEISPIAIMDGLDSKPNRRRARLSRKEVR